MSVAPAVLAAPVMVAAAPVPMMSVIVPPGVAPGGTFQLQAPDGQMMVVACPPGVAPGEQIQVAVGGGGPSPAADVSGALSKLGGEGFQLGPVKGQSTAPGDGETMLMGMVACSGMVAHQVVKDLSGQEIATIHYASNNIQRGQQSVRIVATDGALIASFDRPKFQSSGLMAAGSDYQKMMATPWQIVVNGAHYASVLIQQGARTSMGTMPFVLTRADGSGGLRTGARLSKQGYYTCMAFALWVPTFTLGSWPFLYLAYTSPTLIELQSHDGARTFSPLLSRKSNTTVAFNPEVVPSTMDKPMKKALGAYVQKLHPGPLDGAARLDALCLLAVMGASQTLTAGDGGGGGGA